MSCLFPKQKRLVFVSCTASPTQTTSDAWWCLCWLSPQPYNTVCVVGDTLQKRQCPLHCKSEVQSLCIHKWAVRQCTLGCSVTRGHHIKNLAQGTVAITWVHWRRAGLKGTLERNQGHAQASGTQLMCHCMVTEPYTWPQKVGSHPILFPSVAVEIWLQFTFSNAGQGYSCVWEVSPPNPISHLALPKPFSETLLTESLTLQ